VYQARQIGKILYGFPCHNKRVELILASFQRQEIQSREESRKREILLFGMTTELQERIDIHDAKLIDQEGRVTDLESQFSALRIGFDGLENQLSALQLVRSSEQEEGDPDDFELTAGLSSAAAARFEGVTMRESHTRLDSRAQREERERLLDSIDKTLESHNKSVTLFATVFLCYTSTHFYLYLYFTSILLVR